MFVRMIFNVVRALKACINCRFAEPMQLCAGGMNVDVMLLEVSRAAVAASVVALLGSCIIEDAHE